MIRLRPHHLLCTQGYSGKGYSDSFVDNMDHIVSLLRGTADVQIQLVFSSDDICPPCPRYQGPGKCGDDYKVLEMDRKVVEYFDLSPGTYSYRELTAAINRAMTAQRMEDICGTCQWYPISACRRNIRGEVRE